MTNRIKSASVAIFAQDTQLDRVQAFGVSARLDSEDLREIGNLDIVEVIDNVPTVDITLDINQYGSVKALSKFARKNHDWGTLVVTLKDANTVTVSSGSFYINEIKYNLASATDIAIPAPTGVAYNKRIDTISITTGAAVARTSGTATTGTPVAPATPVGSLKIAEVQRNTGATTGTAVDMTYLNILNVGDDKTVTLKNFETAAVDFVVPVKEDGDNTDTTYPITRSMYIDKAYANRYDASFSVNGLATESFSLESDNKTWFLNTAATIWTDRYLGNTSGFTLTYTPVQRDNRLYTIKVYKFNRSTGVYTDLVENTDYSVAGTALTTTATLTTDEVLIARYAATSVPTSAQPFFKRVPQTMDSHPSIAGGLKHGQVEIFLSDDAANHVLRLQSVSISASLSREALYEISHKRAYDRPMTFPIPITIQVEALAADLKEFARLCGKTFATAKELSIADFLKNLNLTVKIYREDDVIRGAAPEVQAKALKTITVTAVSVTDENTDIRVDGNATQTFGLKANTNLSIVAGI